MPDPDVVPMSALSLSAAQRVADAAVAAARSKDLAACIAVCDPAGAPILTLRMDGAPRLCAEIALNKAYTVSVFNGMPTDKWWPAARRRSGPGSRLSRTPSRLIVFPGGVPVHIDGAVVGAVGVSGGSTEQDREIAQAGADAVGLVTTHLRQVWDRGDTALGAFLFFREPLIAEAAALAGYDYVCIDMQHGLQSFEHTVTMLYAMARTDSTPIVRVPWNEPSIIGRVLDAGAYGVIVPMVNTADEARAAVAACRYAPIGSRSMGPVGVSARAGREGTSRPPTSGSCASR